MFSISVHISTISVKLFLLMARHIVGGGFWLKCALPEYIHISPTDGTGISWGCGRGRFL